MASEIRNDMNINSKDVHGDAIVSELLDSEGTNNYVPVYQINTNAVNNDTKRLLESGCDSRKPST